MQSAFAVALIRSEENRGVVFQPWEAGSGGEVLLQALVELFLLYRLMDFLSNGRAPMFEDSIAPMLEVLPILSITGTTVDLTNASTLHYR